MTDVDPNQTRAYPQGAAPGAATTAEPKGPVIPWGRHSWLWLSLIGAGIAVLFFVAGFAASSVMNFATHSVHQMFLQGGVGHGYGPHFDHRGDGDGDGNREFPGLPGRDRDSSRDDTAPSS